MVHVPLNYTDEKSIAGAATMIEQKYSDFEILIHCTGIGYIESFEKMETTHSQEMMNVNLTGPTLLSSKLLPLVKRNGADILYV